jgi:hypothetical protein
VRLGAELEALVDEYARRMADREPGFKVSRSAALRQLLCRALAAGDGAHR